MNHLGYLKLGLRWEPISKVFLSGAINYADAEYPMKIWENNLDTIFMNGEPRRVGFGASVGYLSIFGPIQVSVARDFSTPSYITNLALGFWF
jgi:hypothetical protein